MTYRLREARGSDSLAAAEVVREVFAEYGFTWEEDGYNADLYDLEGHYLALGNPFWVAEASPSPCFEERGGGGRGWGSAGPSLFSTPGEKSSESRPVGKGGSEEGGPIIVATCGLALFERLPGRFGELVRWEEEVRIGAADCSLERLYVRPSIRRAGLGSALLEHAIGEARRQGRKTMEIWSDKKLTLAHRLYERRGAIRVGDRICDDPDESPEWGMALALGG